MTDMHEWLERFEFAPSMFKLGIRDSRVTILSQQQRALNMIAALRSSARLEGKKVSVIGAGFGGLTAAVAAARCGGLVTLHDESDQLIHRQANSQRWVHPNLMRWPEDDWRDDRTFLPFLNWTAKEVGSVVRSLADKFETYQRDGLGVTERLGHIVEMVKRVDDDTIHVYQDGPPTEANLLIVATGFGSDAVPPSIDYWHDDNLDINPGKRCLVSGTGDGGLIDFLRASLTRFEHHDLKDFLSPLEVQDIRPRIQSIENHALSLGLDRRAASKHIVEQYAQIQTPQLTSIVMSKVNPHVKVTLNGRDIEPFGTNSFPVNRFIVSRITSLNYRPFDLDKHDKLASGPTWHIKGEYNAEFERLVIRHGPKVDPLENIGSIQIPPQYDRRKLPLQSIETTKKIWKFDDFGQSERPKRATRTNREKMIERYLQRLGHSEDSYQFRSQKGKRLILSVAQGEPGEVKEIRLNGRRGGKRAIADLSSSLSKAYDVDSAGLKLRDLETDVESG